MDRERLYRKADERFDAMMREGLLEEVRQLRDLGFGRDSYVANAYGYAELLAYLDGSLGLEQAVRQAKAKTRAYIRRQLTWCRSLPSARWFESTGTEEVADRLAPFVIGPAG
jgi:tRNA dimethylallyltransferase